MKKDILLSLLCTVAFVFLMCFILALNSYSSGIQISTFEYKVVKYGAGIMFVLAFIVARMVRQFFKQ